MKALMLLLTVLALAGCAGPLKPTSEELAELSSSSAAAISLTKEHFPATIAWFNETEAFVLADGRPLSATEYRMAEQIGVLHPEGIRVAVQPSFPAARDAEFREALNKYVPPAFLQAGMSGQPLRHLLKPRVSNRRDVLAHEMVHVMQTEQLGKEGFVKRMMNELVIVARRLSSKPTRKCGRTETGADVSLARDDIAQCIIVMASAPV